MSKPLTVGQQRALVRRGQEDSVWWVEGVLQVQLAEMGKKIARSVERNRITLVRSCHATSKTFTAAGIGLWWCSSKLDRMVITTATSAMQSKFSIWREFEKLCDQAEKAGRPTGGKVLTTEAKWAATRSVAFARTVPKSTNPDTQATMFHGTRSAGGTLAILDEATAIPSGIFTGARAVLTGANDRLLIMCNPTDPASEVARMFKTLEEAPGRVCKIRMSAFDSPNIAPFGVTLDDIASGEFTKKVPPLDQTPFPFLTNAFWVRDVWEAWTDRGLRMTDPRWVSRVMGEFPEEGTDVLIPMPWIEAAMALYTGKAEGAPEYACDVADRGDDSSELAERRDAQVRFLGSLHGQDVMATTGMISGHLRENRQAPAKIDSNGVGTGVWARLKELGYNAVEVNVSRMEGIDKDRFKNARSQYLWEVRQRCQQSWRLVNEGACDGPHLELEPNEEAKTQLNAYKWKQNSAGQIEVEPKDETKKRLGGKSPDKGDAVMIACVPVAFDASERVEVLSDGDAWGRLLGG